MAERTDKKQEETTTKKGENPTTEEGVSDEHEHEEITLEDLLRKWVPDRTKDIKKISSSSSSSDGIAGIEINGAHVSYLQILVDNGFDCVESLQFLTEVDMKQMNFKTGHLRMLYHLKQEYFAAKREEDEKKNRQTMQNICYQFVCKYSNMS